MSYTWNVLFFDASGHAWPWRDEGEGFLSERAANNRAREEMNRQKATGWRLVRRLVRD